MNLALLLPGGLAALAALLLPLLIHLARRSEWKITQFAALRWLGERARPRRKQRFEDWPLLLVRLLLLLAIALLLAEPVLYGRPDRTPWIVALPGVPAQRVREAAGEQRANVRWLAPGFPPLDRAPSTTARQPMASLLRELDADLPAGAPLSVLVPAVFDGADAERPRLSRRIDWRIVAAVALIDATPAPAAPMQLDVRHAADREAALRYLQASAIAWSAADETHAKAVGASGTRTAAGRAAVSSSVTIAPAGTALDPRARHLVWLVPGVLPTPIREWIAAGGVALVDAQTVAPELAGATPLWRADDGTPRVVGMPLGRGRLLQLRQPMTPAAMPELLDAGFAQRLRSLFQDAAPEPMRAGADAYAPLTGALASAEMPRPLAPWLVLLVACLFLVERLLATRGKVSA